jgi:hypothetical protein
LMSSLVELRQVTAGKLDFDHVARMHGARVLREWDSDISAATIDKLIAAALEILSNMVRLRLN